MTKIAIYFIGVTAISLVGDLVTIPPIYLSHKRNLFNQYFIKLGWGWTLSNTAALLILSTLVKHRGEFKNFGKPLLRMLLMTLYWYVCTHLFEWLENFTGSCSNTGHSTKRLCIREGHAWLGFDLSGHCFLMVHCLLFINEEARVLRGIAKKLDDKDSMSNSIATMSTYRLLLRLTVSILACLHVLWEVTLVITALYYHTTIQKLFACILGAGGWYIVYRVLKLRDSIA